MRQLFSIVMLIAIFTQLLWGSGYLVDYYVNTDYYKSLCVNKELPQLNCDGKCVLAKKIKQQANEKNDPVVVIPISNEYTWGALNISFLKTDTPDAPKLSQYINSYSHLFEWDIFKPPI